MHPAAKRLVNHGRRRIIIIGPVLPFRGGIAQHTTMLHRALSQLAEHLTISFTRQYPALIFPGESDRDPAYERHEEMGVEYLIDSLNPLSWRKAVKRVLAFNADIVVLPWWTVYWAFCFGYLANALQRKGVTVVFFCHNVIDHESAMWKVKLTKWVLSHGNRFVVHTKKDATDLHNLIPSAAVAVHAHPIYVQFPVPKGELAKRGNLELLFYGFVRPYKGLDILVEAMAKTPDTTHLTIAGEFWGGEDMVRNRIKDLGIAKRVEVCPRYHTDQETAELFARSDLVVLPYLSATGSGVVPVAYHYNKPVIVTRVGGLPDVVDDGKTGKIIEPGNIDALADAINSFTRSDATAMVPAIQELKRNMTWSSLAETLLDAH